MIARTYNDVQSTDRCNGDRSLCPIDAMRNNQAREGILGHGFPDGTLSETAPHYSGEFRDAVSRWGLLGKLHPTPKTGRGFPKDRISRPPLVKIIRFPLSHAEHPRSVPECRHNRNVPSCRQHFAATAKPARAIVVTCAGLVGAHKGTLQRPTSVMDYRTAPARDASVGVPSDEACRSPRQSAQCRQSADTAK